MIHMNSKTFFEDAVQGKEVKGEKKASDLKKLSQETQYQKPQLLPKQNKITMKLYKTTY